MGLVDLKIKRITLIVILTTELFPPPLEQDQGEWKCKPKCHDFNKLNCQNVTFRSFGGKIWAHSRVLWRPETNLSYLTNTEVLDLDIRFWFMQLNWHLAEHWRHSEVNHHPQDFPSHQGNQPKVFWPILALHPWGKKPRVASVTC